MQIGNRGGPNIVFICAHTLHSTYKFFAHVRKPPARAHLAAYS